MNKLRFWKIGFFTGAVMILLILNLVSLSAGETKNIEYALNISFEPYCINSICNNETIFENRTVVINETTNQTKVIEINYTKQTCSSNCYGKLKVDGVDENRLFFEIDTGSDRWKNGSSEFRYGYKTADLGNLSDISGIREELNNLTTCFSDHLACNTNLTECKLREQTCQSSIADKSMITQKLNDWNTKKWYFLLGGILLGALFIWKGLPIIQGRKNPRDPTEQFPSNVPYR